jgi:hypothetical protein
MTTSRDLILLLGLVAFLSLCAAFGFVLRARFTGLLTRREWIVFGEVVAIILMIFLLYLVKISRAFPPEMFIYGRF